MIKPKPSLGLAAWFFFGYVVPLVVVVVEEVVVWSLTSFKGSHGSWVL